MRPATKLCVDPPLCTCRINTGLSPNMFMQTAKALTCTWPRPARCSDVHLPSKTFSKSCALVPGRILWTTNFEADTPTSSEWPSRHQRGNLNARSKDPPHSYNESRGKCWKVGSSSGVGSSRTVMTNPAGTGADVTSRIYTTELKPLPAGVVMYVTPERRPRAKAPGNEDCKHGAAETRAVSGHPVSPKHEQHSTSSSCCLKLLVIIVNRYHHRNHTKSLPTRSFSPIPTASSVHQNN